MQRYFIPPEQFFESSVTIIGGDAHHIIRVMRSEIGDTVICSNGKDREVLVSINLMDKELVEANILEDLPLTNESAIEVWIAQSLPKGDKLETIIQKNTEIGASRFIPFVSERTIVQYDEKKALKLQERWGKIAKEAAEQAHRNRVPAIDASTYMEANLKANPRGEACFDLLREGKSAATKAASEDKPLSSKPGKTLEGKVLILIGPEGGFTVKEIAEAEAAGCHSISLGSRILRTETAAMVALTCILYETGEMGG